MLKLKTPFEEVPFDIVRRTATKPTSCARALTPPRWGHGTPCPLLFGRPAPRPHSYPGGQAPRTPRHLPSFASQVQFPQQIALHRVDHPPAREIFTGVHP
jgi:hypothetical protein